MSSLGNAKQYAVLCHTGTNHLYDGKSYELHLQMVVDYADKYLSIMTGRIANHDMWIVGAVAWCHDVIEDTRQTYNDVVNAMGGNPEIFSCSVMIAHTIADAVFDLTNEKGKTRSDRANDKYYAGIRDNFLAHYIKLCDRLANVDYSKKNGSKMFDMYKKEYPLFRDKLYDINLIKPIIDLDHLIYD